MTQEYRKTKMLVYLFTEYINNIFYLPYKKATYNN